MDIKTEAINKAIRLLDAAKAKYKIITSDGQEFGELVIVAPKSKRTNRHRIFANTGYIEKIKNLQVGDVIYLEPPEGSDVAEMRCAISGSLCRMFGSHSCMTKANRETNRVEILRIT